MLAHLVIFLMSSRSVDYCYLGRKLANKDLPVPSLQHSSCCPTTYSQNSLRSLTAGCFNQLSVLRPARLFFHELSYQASLTAPFSIGNESAITSCLFECRVESNIGVSLAVSPQLSFHLHYSVLPQLAEPRAEAAL